MYRRELRLILGTSALLVAGYWGLHVRLLWPGESDWRLYVVVAALLAMLCVVDARIERRPIPPLSGWVLFALGPLAPSAMLIWQHRRIQRLYAVLYLVAFVILYSCGSFFGWAILQYRLLSS